MNEMPLNDRDFAEIRGNVMREIARRQRRNAMFLAGSVVFAVLALVFVLIPRPEPAGGGRQVAVGGSRAEEAVRHPQPATRNRTPAITIATTEIAPVKHHRKHHRAHKPQPIAIASTEPQTPLTIELQTANPDVRIIWIAK